MKEKTIKDAVRDRYSQIVECNQQTCCSDCCTEENSLIQAEKIGYLQEDLESIPEESIMGLGCGNPTAIAELEAGETVLDLGSGAGIDVFLAANKVGPEGRVIGVDMTSQMIERANSIAKNNNYDNVEFRLGEIEQLPVDDSSVDTIISNCVINLSPDKSAVFHEAYRVLKPGGKLIVSDIVSEQALPGEMRNNLDAWAGCIGGALEQQEYLGIIKEAGFHDLQVVPKREFYVEVNDSRSMVKLSSITVKARKHE